MTVETYRAIEAGWKSLMDGHVTQPGGSNQGGPPIIGFIGESTTAQGKSGRPDSIKVYESLIDHGWDESSRVDGLVGRNIYGRGPHPYTGEVIASWRGDGFDPYVWVFAIGGNDGDFNPTQLASHINSVIDIIDQGPRSSYKCYWFTMARADKNSTRPPEMLQGIQQAAASRSGKSTLTPVNLQAAMHPIADDTSLWTGDGRHMTYPGYDVRNEVVSTLLDPLQELFKGRTLPAFGFNTYPSYNAYVYWDGDTTSNETYAQELTRLHNDYGPFEWQKLWETGFPSTANGRFWNTNDSPKNSLICVTWTAGNVANGSMDSTIDSFIASVPNDQRVILTWNEIDNHLKAGGNWTQYKADADRIYDRIAASGSTNVEYWDCFMGWSVDSQSGPLWKDSWVNASKRHGIVWDIYWDNGDTTNRRLGPAMEATNRLDLPWLMGECGDRRVEDKYTPTNWKGTDLHGQTSETTDASRAGKWMTRYQMMMDAAPAPQAIIHFPIIGTTGDHRIITWDNSGPDAVTHQVIAELMAQRAQEKGLT